MNWTSPEMGPWKGRTFRNPRRRGLFHEVSFNKTNCPLCFGVNRRQTGISNKHVSIATFLNFQCLYLLTYIHWYLNKYYPYKTYVTGMIAYLLSTSYCVVCVSTQLGVIKWQQETYVGLAHPLPTELYTESVLQSLHCGHNTYISLRHQSKSRKRKENFITAQSFLLF